MSVLAIRRLWHRQPRRRHRGNSPHEGRARSARLVSKATRHKVGATQAVKCPSVEQAKDLLRKAIIKLKGMATLSELGHLYKACCWKPALEECRMFVDRHPQHFRTKETRRGAQDVEDVTVQLVEKPGALPIAPNVEESKVDEELFPRVMDYIRQGGGIVRITSLLQKVYGPAAGLVTQSSVRAFAEVHSDFFYTHDSWESQGEIVKQRPEPKVVESEPRAYRDDGAEHGPRDEDIKPLDDPYLQLPTTTLFSSWYVQQRLQKPTLLPIPSLRDASNLTKLFQNNIARKGFLSAALVRAEIDTACKSRQWTETKLFAAGEAGRLLAGMSKMLFVVDTTLQVVFATQCIMTLRDVELAILRHPVFRGKDSLQEACIGDLQYHPEVQKRFQFPAGKIPKTIHDVTTWALLSRLKMRGGAGTTAAVHRVLQDLEKGKDAGSLEPDTRSSGQEEKKKLVRPVVDALQGAARSFGYQDFREMGVYIQEGTTLHQIVPVCTTREKNVQRRLSRAAESEAQSFGSWLALSSPDEHRRFLEGLAVLQSDEAIDRFIKAVESKEKMKQRPREDKVADYVKDIFRRILRTAEQRQYYPGYLEREQEKDNGTRGTKGMAQGSRIEAKDVIPSSALPIDVPSKLPAAAAASVEAVDQDAPQGRQIAVVEHLVAIVENLATANSKSSDGDNSALNEHSVPWLLQLLQKAEAEVCRARGVSSFESLQLRVPFSGFVAEHSAEILKAAGPIGGLAQLQSDIMVFCSKLLIKGYSQEQVRSVARAHFGAALSGLEIDVAAEAAQAQEFASGGDPLAREFAIAVAQAGLLEEWAPSPSTGKEMDELADEAVAVIAQVPHLMDLALTLDDTWDHNFGFSLGKLTDFLQSTEFTDRVAKRFRVVEVRRGMFITLPLRDSVDWMAALEARDARLAAAIVLARLLDDGHDAPTELLEDTLKRSYRGWINSQPGLAEYFVLTATAALPPGTPKKALDILVGSYRSLARPHKDLVEAARAAPEFCVASQRLGRHFGVLAWEHISWEEKYNVHMRFGNALVEGQEEKGSIRSVAPKVTAEEESPVAEPDIQPLDEGDNKLLCEDICLKRKVALKHVDPKTRQWVKPPEDVGVLALQTTLQGAVKRLAADLYGREAHFLLELVQNADDCRFPTGVIPTFSLTVETHAAQFPLLTTFADTDVEAMCVLEHNELGFKAKNVRAISDIAQSTKAAEDKRFIGEKGIGFKSVFRATDTPVVHSNKYHFHFDANGVNGLGCLLPFPLAAPPNFEEEMGTRIVLPLRGAQHAADVCAQVMEDMQPMLLLFLRRIEQLKLLNAKAGHRRVMRKVVRSVPGLLTGSEEVILKTRDSDVTGSTSEESAQHWFVHTMALEESREGVLRASSTEQRALDADIAQTELKLAFRLDLAGDVPQQEAFAWLPLRSYGFRFVVQADWKVPSSREAITGTDAFNQFVREKVPEAFTGAVEAFVRRAVHASQGCIAPSVEATAELDEEVTSAEEEVKSAAELEAARLATLQMLAPMYGALPLEGDGLDFFRRTPGAILEALQQVRCVLVHGPGGRLAFARPGESVLPTLTKLATELSQTTLEEQLPEIEPLLIASKHYREAGGLSAHAAQVLRIPPLNGRIAMDCLEIFAERHASGGLSAASISALHLLLLALGCDEAQQTRQTIERLRQLTILPTSKGELVAAAHSNVFDVDSKFAAALTDIQALDRRLRKICHPRVRQLLDRLGVKKADGKEFFELELMPRLTRGKAKEAEIVACTQCAKSFLNSCNDEDRRAYADELQDRGFWVIAEKIQEEGSERCVVRIDRKTALRLAKLPAPFAKVKSLQWLWQRWYCPSPDYAGTAPLEEVTEDEEEEWSWEDFWLCVGAWPTVEVKAAVGQSGEEGGAFKDYTSPELRRLFTAVQQHRQVVPVDKTQLATTVVEMLAPHGEFYEAYLSAPAPARLAGGRSKAPDAPLTLRTEMAEMLCKEPWIPTVSGELAAPQGGWLAPSAPRTAAHEYHHAERSFVFQKVASKLSEAWPSLGIEAKPTGAILLRIIQGLVVTKNPKLSLRQMSVLYLHLSVALRKESADVGLDRFLANERWLFVPHHPRPHGMFEKRFDHARGGLDTPRTGAFYKTDELVMKDPNNMLDSYFDLFSDESLALVRRGAALRVVGNYYWGPSTRLPLRWGRYEYDKESTALHGFFQKVGIRMEAGWLDYINVLKEVDRFVQEQPVERYPEEIIFHIMQQLGREVRAEVECAKKETELAGALMAPKDGPAEVAQQEEGPPRNMARVNLKYWCSATLHKFLEGTSELHFVPTLGGTWAHLGQVQFVFRGSEKPDWTEDALRLVARTEDTREVRRHTSREEIADAFRLCGLHAQPTTREQVAFTLEESMTQVERASLLLKKAMQLMAQEVQKYAIDAVETGTKGLIGFDSLLDACVKVAPSVNFVSAALFRKREAVLLSEEAAERAALPAVQLEEEEMAVWSSASACDKVAVAITQEAEVVWLTHYAGWRRVERSQESQLVCAMKVMDKKTFSECNWGRSLIPKLLEMAARAAATLDGAATGSVVGLREVEQVMIQTLRRVVQKALEDNPFLLEEEEGEDKQEDAGEEREEERRFDWQALLDSLDQDDIFTELAQEQGESLIENITADDVGKSLAAALDALDPRRRTQPWMGHRFVPEGEPLDKREQQKKKEEAEGEGDRAKQPRSPPGDDTDGASDGAEESVAPFSLVQANKEGKGDEEDGAVDPGDLLPEFLSLGSMPTMPPLPKAGVQFKVPAKSLDFAVTNARLDSLSLNSRMLKHVGKSYNIDVEDLGTFGQSAYTDDIGRFGEAVAAEALAANGYTVHWLNDGEETGLPFDFLAVPPGATPEVRQRLKRLEGPDSLLQSTNLQEIPGLLYVEVKTSSSPSEAFHVSFNQIQMMRRLGQCYWLARVVVWGRPHVKLWKGFGEDVRESKVPILMALPEF